MNAILGPGRVPEETEVLLCGRSDAVDSLGPLDEGVVLVRDDNIPKSAFGQMVWRKRELPRVLRRYGVQIHYNPVGYFGAEHHLPRIGMSRNLQGFVPRERRRMPLVSRERLHVELLLRHSLRNFAGANGMIYLSEFARSLIEPMLPGNGRRAIVIPHGIHDVFRREAKIGPLPERPQLLYVSPVLEYKHQWSVVEAVDIVRRTTGGDIQLKLVGGGNRRAVARLDQELRLRGRPEWVHQTGQVPYSRLPELYQSADIFVFASTVENCPNTLLEAMASGLPIVCSEFDPMPEFAGNAALYFDPHNPRSLAEALLCVLVDPDSRENLARRARARADSFSWGKTADATFEFLREFA